MARYNAGLLLAIMLAVATVATARPQANGRHLLAATDDRFNFYRNQCRGKNVMVCKTCTAAGVNNANPNGSRDGGFEIWCLDSGVITRQGDGGTDNWQFTGCFTRSGVQGSTVTFTPIKSDGTC